MTRIDLPISRYTIAATAVVFLVSTGVSFALAETFLPETPGVCADGTCITAEDVDEPVLVSVSCDAATDTMEGTVFNPTTEWMQWDSVDVIAYGPGEPSHETLLGFIRQDWSGKPYTTQGSGTFTADWTENDVNLQQNTTYHVEVDIVSEPLLLEGTCTAR